MLGCAKIGGVFDGVVTEIYFVLWQECVEVIDELFGDFFVIANEFECLDGCNVEDG